MELEGGDLSHLEPSFQFHALGKPPSNITISEALPATPTILLKPQTFDYVEPGDSGYETDGDLDVTNMIDLSIPAVDDMGGIPFSDRLGACKNFWRDTIKAPKHILTALEEGVDIGLVDNVEDLLPKEGIYIPNRVKKPDELAIIKDTITELVKKGIAGRTLNNKRPRICLPFFLEPKPDGRFRVIWNGKALKDYLKKTGFSYELLTRFLEAVPDLANLGKLDLVDGFFAVKVKPSQRTYLGFSLYNPITNETEFYEFHVLPQGISTAPYIFSRFTLAITAYLRRTITDASFITYLDDLGWAIHPAVPTTRRSEIHALIRDTFLRAGWVLSVKKSLFNPLLTSLVLLGVQITTTPHLQVDFPPDRKQKLLTLITDTLGAPTYTPRTLMSIGGSLQSAVIILGPSITLFLRNTYCIIADTIGGDAANKSLWDGLLPRSEEVSFELLHWKSVLEGSTFSDYHRPVWLISDSDLTDQGLTDASGTALGGIALDINHLDPTEVPLGEAYWFDKLPPHAGEVLFCFGHYLSVKMLTPQQQQESSTFRELLGVIHLVKVHRVRWSGKCVRIFVDNAAVVKIYLRGSSIPHLHRLVQELVKLLTSSNIRIKLIWIKRALNMGADLMSRQYQQAYADIEDYQLTDEAFNRLQRLYGKFNRDMFANAENAKCPLYVSRYADVGSQPGNIDAFYQPAWGHNFYAFPPVDDSYKALEHILHQPNARGLLVLPLWVRLNTFHRLFPDGNHLIPQVIGWTLLKHRDFTKGTGHASFLSVDRGGHNTPFLAILLDTSANPVPLNSSPPYRFCLKGYYGDLSECPTCWNP